MKSELQKKLLDNKINFLQLQFIDIVGIPKQVEVPRSQFAKALDGEIGFDGSSIDGFTRIEESDMLLHPDLNSFAVYPWSKSEGKIARLICDIYHPDGDPFAGCPRMALKRILAQAKKLGFDFMVGPEAEFFLFKLDSQGRVTTQTHDQGTYFDMSPSDEGEVVRREVVNHLISLGLEIEAAHHEVSHGQHEIDFKYRPALLAADSLMDLKLVVKKIARKHNLYASFMPKPINGVHGSGMHCHMSLMKDGNNLFFDAADEMQLSPLCRHFIGGILSHAKGFTAVTNPCVNSYKRLLPGFEAPINIVWSEKNRSPLVRIPASRGGGTRVEVRLPDLSSNPYLAMLAMLAAGLDGIEQSTEPPPSINKNIFKMSEREKGRLKIDAVPNSLNKALRELKKDKIITKALGEHIFSHFHSSKKLEWKEYNSTVHQWEMDRYLSIF